MTKGSEKDEVREVTREQLYDAVWSTPVNHLAEKYGVSGSYLARVCNSLNVPRPPAGYWQKKAVGKEGPRPELPEALPGDQLAWRKDQPLATPVRPRTPAKRNAVGRKKLAGSGRHPLLFQVEELFRRSRDIDEGDFLRPYKLLLPDLVSTDACLTKSLDLANKIYRALEQKGYRVLIAPTGEAMERADLRVQETPKQDLKYGKHSMGRIWAPHRPTIAYFGDTPIGLSLTEMTERVSLRWVNGKYVRDNSKSTKSLKSWQLTGSWTTERDLPCGRYRFTAYSPYRGVNWVRSWQEAEKADLAAMIPKIIRELEGAVERLKRLKQVADTAEAQQQIEWEQQRERWRRDEDKRRVEAALNASRTQLAEIMEKWNTAATIERFFQEVEARLETVDGSRRTMLQERLTLARSMIGMPDPLEFLESWVAPEERYRSRYLEGNNGEENRNK